MPPRQKNDQMTSGSILIVDDNYGQFGYHCLTKKDMLASHSGYETDAQRIDCHA